MLDILVQIGLDPKTFFTIFILCVLITVFAFKRFFTSFMDPILIFVITLCANEILLFGLDWGLQPKVEGGIFFVCLWCGFALFGKLPQTHTHPSFDKKDLFELDVILVLLCGVIVLANLYLGATAGFPLLSSNPSAAKIESFQGGLGFVRHLNFYPFYYLVCGCFLLLFLGHRRRLMVSLLCITSAFIALSGSKSALLFLVLALAMLTAHKGVRGSLSQVRTFRRYALLIFLISFCVAILVLVIDQGSLGMGVVQFARRLLFYGDVVLYYYPRRGQIPELWNAGLVQYLDYLLNSTLGMLRLVPYKAPLGTVLTGSLDDGFGPNPLFFVQADIFFGSIAGCFYCFAIGATIAFLRRMFFVCKVKNVVVFAFMLLIATSAFDLAVDAALFVGSTLDVLLILALLWPTAIVLRVAILGVRKVNPSPASFPAPVLALPD